MSSALARSAEIGQIQCDDVAVITQVRRIRRLDYAAERDARRPVLRHLPAEVQAEVVDLVGAIEVSLIPPLGADESAERQVLLDTVVVCAVKAIRAHVETGADELVLRIEIVV